MKGACHGDLLQPGPLLATADLDLPEADSRAADRGHSRAERGGHPWVSGGEAGKVTAATAHRLGKHNAQSSETRLVPGRLPFRIHTQITSGITRIFLPSPNHPPPRIWVTIWD